MAESKSAQQVREITDKLEQGIKELFESERFKEYLRTMSKFYHYSLIIDVIIDPVLRFIYINLLIRY